MATLKFPIEVGALLRGPFRRELKSLCWERGYEITIEEDRGLLESLLRVRIELPDSDGPAFSDLLHGWFRQIESH